MMMKVFGCLALLGIGAWFLFGGSEQAVAQTSSGKKVNTPQSKRSLKAARKVTPALKRDLTAKGLQLGAPVFLRALKDEQ